MKYLVGFILGLCVTAMGVANAGMFSSALGGAAGAALATSGLEAKVETINARLEALTRALDSVKVCK